MSFLQIILLGLFVGGMALGQILFKSVSSSMRTDSGFVDAGVALLLNIHFLIALAIYLALTILWVWLLTFTPLSRAYLFSAGSFLLVPVLSHWLFGEPLSPNVLLGMVAIAAGVVLVST
jgi:drug/metabolite transporter (DMT)-like permease